jgi:hypothetical protein
VFILFLVSVLLKTRTDNDGPSDVSGVVIVYTFIEQNIGLKSGSVSTNSKFLSGAISCHSA